MSLRARDWGFPLAMRKLTPASFLGKYKKIKPRLYTTLEHYENTLLTTSLDSNWTTQERHNSIFLCVREPYITAFWKFVPNNTVRLENVSPKFPSVISIISKCNQQQFLRIISIHHQMVMAMTIKNTNKMVTKETILQSFIKYSLD